jgi:hypothetical protein
VTFVPHPDGDEVLRTSRTAVERAAATLVAAVVAHGRATDLSRAAQALRDESRGIREAGRVARADEVRYPTPLQVPALRTDLQTGVSRYALALRGAGLPPETMLRQVKEAVAPALRSAGRDERVARISEDVVRWSLDAYYAD